MPTIHYASRQFLKQINWSNDVTADGLITSSTSSSNNDETKLTSTTYASGRLTQIEQDQFEYGIVTFGMGKWKEIADGIPTRSKAQVVAIGNYLKRNNKSSIKELYLGRPKKQPVDVEIVMKQTIPQKVCTITPVDLRRVNDEVIWVLVGKSEHPAYLLNDGSSSSSSSSSSVNNGMVWVEWLSNGRKECIAKQQIVIGGLQSRKRSRPNHLEDFVLSSQAGAECLLLLSGKDMSAIEKPQPVSSKNDELQSLAYDISTGSGHDQLPSRSVTPLDQPHLFGLSVDWTCTCGKIVAGEKKRRHCNKVCLCYLLGYVSFSVYTPHSLSVYLPVARRKTPRRLQEQNQGTKEKCCFKYSRS